MLSLPKMTWMPDINIAWGRGGGGEYMSFYGLLPFWPGLQFQVSVIHHGQSFLGHMVQGENWPFVSDKSLNELTKEA